MKGRIVIAGSIAQKPLQGGHTWVYLQYILGFRRLGWEVLFVDRLEVAMCRNEAGQPCSIEESFNLARFLEVMQRFGLEESFALLVEDGSRIIGRPRAEVLDFAASAACLLNIMGFLGDQEILGQIKRRVFLDIDPGFPQMWRELGLADVFAGHHDFVTIGENIGRPDCKIPTCGLNWITTGQPVVMDEWPVRAEWTSEWFTTIATWRGAYGPVEYQGQNYGLRVHEFRKFLELPVKSGQSFEMALDIHADEAADLGALRSNGWLLVDPKLTVSGPWAYRAYVQSSKAELMIAKNMYVASRSGWFSDRSICYLACGRPVLAQETGFSQCYPVGCGLVSFNNVEEAVAGIREINDNYAIHCKAARNIAEAYFDSNKVLSTLLTKLRL